MSGQGTRQFLELYKDVILNGLDLVSFVLVTPELVRLARPMMPGVTSAAAAALSLALVMVALSLLPNGVGSFVLQNQYFNVLVAVCIISALRYVIYPLIKQALTDARIWISAFYLGVVLFFVARALGVALALLELRSAG